MDNIEIYIKKIQKKKSFLGGFDKETVYEIMKELYVECSNELDRLKAEKEQLREDLHKTAKELEEANSNLQRMSYQLEAEKLNQNEYKEGLAMLVQAVDVINVGKEKIIEEAKTTAEKIVGEANDKYETLIQECLVQQQKMAIMHSNMLLEKQYFDGSMDQLRVGLTEMLSRLDQMQNNDQEQFILQTSNTAKESPCAINEMINGAGYFG